MAEEQSLYDLWSTYSLEAIQARIAALEAENERLRALVDRYRRGEGEIEVCTSELPRWQPQINLGAFNLEDKGSSSAHLS